jgi:hypothetical protein
MPATIRIMATVAVAFPRRREGQANEGVDNRKQNRGHG